MAFRGQRVMLSRSLMPPEMFDMLHSILKENGADVCLCCNPEYNSGDDFHVLTSWESAKFAELQSQGCNVVGPECIMRCAKERRRLPSSKYTCCLSLDGIRLLSTGFDGSEKVRVQQLVIAMCGELCTKATMNIDIVIAKDVLTPKYKWAAFTLRKPILSIQWLEQSFREHRRVPYEPYRLPIFTGLIMCTTGIILTERKRIADLVVENGGTLRADLTRECTHLISKSASSDKFKVAKMQWCHIKCVNEEWFWNSLSEKVCLEETSYEVEDASVSYRPIVIPVPSGPLPTQDGFSQDPLHAGAAARSAVPEVDAHGPLGGVSSVSCEGHQMYLSSCRVYLIGFELVEMQRLVHMVLKGGGTRYMEFNERVTHVILGKPAESELKDIRQYALWGAVHIVMPTWLEACSSRGTEVPVTALFRVPQALLSHDFHSNPGRNKTILVDEKKSVGESMGGRVFQRKVVIESKAHPDAGADLTACKDNDVIQQPLIVLASNPAVHPRQVVAPELNNLSTPALSPSEQLVSKEQSYARLHSINSEINDTQQPLVSLVSNPPDTRLASSQDHRKQTREVVQPPDEARCLEQEPVKSTIKSDADHAEMRHVSNTTSSTLQPNFDADKRVFVGRVFAFAPSFEACMRSEVIQWVLEGGGIMLKDELDTGELKEAEFLIHPHGPKKDPCTQLHVKSITTQWIKYCLQEVTLLDINSHILFQPLCCEIPLSGFGSFRFVVSQYSDSERILLYNLCYVLGAKYQEKKMNKKATHLLCKVGGGEKYEAALQWGVETVTAEWLYACVAENKVVLLDPYRPQKLTAADKEAGLSILSTPFATEMTFPEKSSSEINADVLLSENVNNVGEQQMKGKTLNTKRKSNLRPRSAALESQALHGNKASTNLSSQMKDGNLDPWDELTASWTDENLGRRPSTRSQRKALNSLSLSSNVPVNLEQSNTQSELKTQRDLSEDLKHSDKATGVCRLVRNSGDLQNPADLLASDTEEDESGADVASAIEGLLAQTSRVQSEDTSRGSDVDRHLLSPDSKKLSRRNGEDLHEHADYKRPKLVSNRSTESGGEQLVQSVTPTEDSFERFEESQMDSQVVAYGEDSEKQRIMERVRTRSMSTHNPGSGTNVQRREMSWKDIEFKRLLKAADANK